MSADLFTISSYSQSVVAQLLAIAVSGQPGHRRRRRAALAMRVQEALQERGYTETQAVQFWRDCVEQAELQRASEDDAG